MGTSDPPGSSRRAGESTSPARKARWILTERRSKEKVAKTMDFKRRKSSSPACRLKIIAAFSNGTALLYRHGKRLVVDLSMQREAAEASLEQRHQPRIPVA